MSGVRAPRVSFVTRGSETADGLYEFETNAATNGANRGAALGSSSTVRTVVLARRAETTVFGKYLILLAGSRIFVKTIEKRTPPRDNTLRYNTPQWEATYQNVAWQHGLAPRVYGYDNKRRIITMAPLVKTLASLFVGDQGKFSKDMQLKYVELVHCLDKIGIVHGDLVPENVMLDSFGNMFLIDFERARQITETETQRTGSHPNLLSCIDEWDNRVETINYNHKSEGNIILEVLGKIKTESGFDVDRFIAGKRNFFRFLRENQKPTTRKGASPVLLI